MTSATTVQTEKKPRGLSEFALATGLASIACAVLYLFTDIGPVIYIATLIFGIAGIVLGIIALAKRQPKGMAVTGLVAGIVGVVFCLAVIIFAMIFLGVFLAQ